VDELSPNAEGKTIAVLYVIGILALAMSWIIFINFQITRSIGRAKEIGMKKLLGASSSDILFQIVSHSVIIISIAILLASVIFSLSRGELSNYLQAPGHILLKAPTIVLSLAIFVSGSILSTIYPAYILISKNARQLVLEKFTHFNDGFKLRRSLIVFQYSASIALMIITFVIIRQVLFMKNKDIGLNINQTVYSYTPMSMIKKEGSTRKLIAFTEEVNRIPGVISTSVSSCIPGKEINFHSNKIYLPGKPEKSGDYFGVITIDHHFQNVFEPKILAGEMFTNEDKPGGPQVVINREACTRLGFDSPQKAIGKFVQVSVTDYLTIPEASYLVKGVIEDFHQESPHKKMQPILLVKDYRWKYEVGFIAMRFKDTGSERELFEKFKEKWDSFYPDDPFEFRSTRNNYELQLKTDESLAMLSVIYTILSIVLAALGLYGMAADSARKRVKEIGIRKINGAKVSEIISLLNLDYLKWVAISFIIASPLAWYAMHRWLEKFAYKTGLEWWLFLIVGLLAMSIALLTVIWQSLKAALMNPVEALRNE
jgi:putative ABC transport system permease protein